MGSGRLWLPSRRQELRRTLARPHAPKLQRRLGHIRQPAGGFLDGLVRPLAVRHTRPLGELVAEPKPTEGTSARLTLKGLYFFDGSFSLQRRVSAGGCHRDLANSAGRAAATYMVILAVVSRGGQPMLGRRAVSAAGGFGCRGAGRNSKASCFWVRLQSGSKPEDADEEIQPDRRTTQRLAQRDRRQMLKKCVTEVGY